MSSGGGNTHWCYQCQQPVCPRRRGTVCPHCDGGFLQELQECGAGAAAGGGRGGGGGSGGNISGRYASIANRDGPDQLFGIIEAFESLMLRSSPEHRVRLMETLDAFMGQSRSLLASREQVPGRMSRSGGFEMFLNGNRPGTRGNNGDFFVQSGLHDLIQDLTVERRGPRGSVPAPQSAIDGMPTIKITRAHLQTDSHCPVCKDQFELGSEARQMPCNHIYHSDCIVPWLVRHNSCPVCRQEIGTGPNPSIGSRSAAGGNSRNDQNPGRRSPFSFLWPFRSSNTTNREYVETTRSSNPATTTANGENHEMHYSGWPFDY
ncbi:putative E3 ubiquitin-protein ligase RHC1A [Silene latifolia]|uniref:putative E3 ubiquitin-protein ligase RHC1A n=1 Tax=Silene latifolia TaxID=37657 RepID=UPI003D76BF61